MAKGPGLYTEIGKKTQGLSLLLSLSKFHVGVRVFVVLIEIVLILIWILEHFGLV